MKLWIDDVRPAPDDSYTWVKSTRDACPLIYYFWKDIVLISLDHDAGDYAKVGGDYIKILDYIEQMTYGGFPAPAFVFHIHSMNPVGVQNMRNIIRRNGWKEI